MNKRYMDFVPAKKDIPKGGVAAKKPIKVTEKSTKKVVRKIPAANPLLDEEIVVEEIFAEREEPVGVSKSSAKLGMVEDLQPKFVKTEVKKRPLGAKKADRNAKTATKPGIKAAAKPATKAAMKPRAKAAAVGATTGAIITNTKNPAPLGQRAKFINTNKVEKRPLSKSGVTRKPVVVPKVEKPKAPEKIISKPEKDSKAGLIIAIILTIILGAAAGTVAFLLLPK